MSQRVTIHATVTPAEAERLTLARERGIRSRSWLIGQIISQWLDNPKRTLPPEPAQDASGLTLQQRRQAMHRKSILDRWKIARLAGSKRGESVERATNRFIAPLPAPERVSRGTLYNWYRRHQAFGLVGLVDRRTIPIEERLKRP